MKKRLIDIFKIVFQNFEEFTYLVFTGLIAGTIVFSCYFIFQSCIEF
jgi:uncharacterized membrane protein